MSMYASCILPLLPFHVEALFLSFPVGVSVDDDLACHGAHAHSSPPFKSVWNGTWAAVWFLNVVCLFPYFLLLCVV